MKTILKSFFLLALLQFFSSCSQNPTEEKKDNPEVKKQDSAAPVNDKNWIDVQSVVSRMDSTTHYDEIIKDLGKPFDEYKSPSTPDEYVILYDVPGVNGAFFWISLDTKSKTFLHWSGEKHEK